MKTRRYTLTAGEYSSYRIFAQVEGPATPALRTLWKEFKEKFGYPDRLPIIASAQGRLLETYFNEQSAATIRMQAYGLKGNGVEDYFLNWLLQEKNFTRLKSDEMWIG